MATNGPYFSHFLLVAIYITGIRFMLGMDPEERRAKGERYLSIAMSMMTEEVNKPSSMPTIRASMIDPCAYGQKHCWHLLGGKVLWATLVRRGSIQEW